MSPHSQRFYWFAGLIAGFEIEKGKRLLAAPGVPEKITVRADTGKVLGYAPIADRGRVAA